MFKPESDCLLKFTSSDESLSYGSFLNSVLDLGVFRKTFGSFGRRWTSSGSFGKLERDYLLLAETGFCFSRTLLPRASLLLAETALREDKLRDFYDSASQRHGEIRGFDEASRLRRIVKEEARRYSRLGRFGEEEAGNSHMERRRDDMTLYNSAVSMDYNVRR